MNETKWIHVCEGMPEENEPVLTCFRTKQGLGVPTIRSLVHGGWLNEYGIMCPYKNVTHWMPLPDMPEV